MVLFMTNTKTVSKWKVSGLAYRSPRARGEQTSITVEATGELQAMMTAEYEFTMATKMGFKAQKAEAV